MRARLLQMQKKGVDEGVEAQKAIYGCMKCEECGTEGAKRCAGCGEVGYCGKACQARGWKAHRRVCRRKEVKTEVDGVGRLPYEVI